jgi:hypothetical protein
MERKQEVFERINLSTFLTFNNNISAAFFNYDKQRALVSVVTLVTVVKQYNN